MLKWIIIVIAGAVILLQLAMLEYQRSLRRCSVYDGRNELQRAYTNYLATGKVDENGSLKPYVFTNAVNLGGTQFHCVVAIAMPRFENDGVLAMSTNRQFVFLSRNREAFMVPSSGAYSGPFFHWGF